MHKLVPVSSQAAVTACILAAAAFAINSLQRGLQALLHVFFVFKSCHKVGAESAVACNKYFS